LLLGPDSNASLVPLHTGDDTLVYTFKLGPIADVLGG
jgi:hypothetical protein